MSALVDLKRYPRDMKIFIPIWEKVENLILNERLISSIEVLREIREGDDELVDWANKHKKMFYDIDNGQIANINKVRRNYDVDYWEREINKDGPWGDPWVIALSISTNAIIVTNENKVKRNRIPFVAKKFGINSLNLLEFFKSIGIE
ncbi:MAG: DUF4411 family protein [Candidatus Altiarchaeota archaeon]